MQQNASGSKNAPWSAAYCASSPSLCHSTICRCKRSRSDSINPSQSLSFNTNIKALRKRAHASSIKLVKPIAPLPLLSINDAPVFDDHAQSAQVFGVFQRVAIDEDQIRAFARVERAEVIFLTKPFSAVDGGRF